MRRHGLLFCFLFILLCGFSSQISAKGEEYNKPTPVAAQDLIRQAKVLRAHEKFDEAIAALKKAIAMAPNCVEAHVLYVETKDMYMEQYEDVRAEYDALEAKEPNNPVYLMVRALGARTTDSGLDGPTRSFTGSTVSAPVMSETMAANSQTGLLQRVVNIAPDWSWGHYAKGRMIAAKDPDAAIAEYRKAIEADPTARASYSRLALAYGVKGDFNAAFEVAKKMSDYHGDFSDTGQALVWRIRYLQVIKSTEDRAKIKTEFMKLAESTRDASTLSEMSVFCSTVFRDRDGEKIIQDQIHNLDPSWYVENGLRINKALNQDGSKRLLLLSTHQLSIYQRINDVGKLNDPNEKIQAIEKILTLKPGRRVRELYYMDLFHIAETSQDPGLIIKYGEMLRALQPFDVVLPAKIALDLADLKVELDKALKYARMADSATAEFHAPVIPPDTNPDEFREAMTDAKQHEIYNLNRSVVLNALGWALCQAGSFAEAEAKLQQSVALKRDKDNLAHWSVALAKTGKTAEAEKIGLEAENLLADSIKAEIARNVNQPAKNFTLQTVDGRTVSLSDLKGKVVMINFWATWCGPCIAEMPDLKKFYEANKSKGFEILAVSGDVKESRQQVIDFAKKRDLGFSILFGETIPALYGVNSFPTSVFVDKDGKVRFEVTGSGAESLKSMEIALNELLK